MNELVQRLASIEARLDALERITHPPRSRDIMAERVARVRELICREFEVTEQQLVRHVRPARILLARFTMARLLSHFNLSLSEIAHWMRRTHSGIRWELEQLQAWMDTDEKIRARVERLEASL